MSVTRAIGSQRSAREPKIPFSLCVSVLIVCALVSRANAQTCPPTVVTPSSESSVIALHFPATSAAVDCFLNSNPSFNYATQWPQCGVSACTITSADQGAFVMKRSGYKQHVEAEDTGLCQQYVQIQGCPPVAQNYRWLNWTKFNENGGTYGPAIVSASGNRQQYSTWIAGQTSGPVNKSFTAVGEVTIDAQTHTTTTACGFQPVLFNPLNTLKVNVRTCEPRFWKVGSQTGHLPLEPISLYIPSGMWARMVTGPNKDDQGPAVLATNAWNTIMSAIGGPQVTIVAMDCGSDGNCVKMEEYTNQGDEHDIGGCADVKFTGNGVDPSTGVITDYVRMRFPSATWQNASDVRLQRTVGHELGHLFSLYHNWCTGADSIVGLNTSCTSIGSLTPTPTAQDIAQANASPYGTGFEKTCGFPVASQVP